MDLSVIIVNYRGWKHLEFCLNSLAKLNVGDFQTEVIVVDNHSNDGHLPEFKDKFPWVDFLSNAGNYGFSSANNLGAFHAKGKFLLFLNPDIIASNEAIFGMMQTLQDHPSVMLLSCRQQNKTGKEEHPYNLFPDLFTTNGPIRSLYKTFHKKELAEKYSYQEELIYPDWVSGSVMMISAADFAKTGGWSEDYWLYYEDVELCWQVRSVGGKVALSNRYSMIHNHGGATRINPKTAAITKAEVRISKHVYISHRFKGLKAFIIHLLIFFGSAFSKLIPAVLSIPCFFNRKLRSYGFMYFRLLTYYFSALVNGTWLSSRAPNYRKLF